MAFYNKKKLKEPVYTNLPYLSLSEGHKSGKFEVEITEVKYVSPTEESDAEGVVLTVKIESSTDDAFPDDSEAQIGFWDDKNGIGLQNFRKMIKQLDPSTTDAQLQSEKFLREFDNSDGKGSKLIGIKTTITAREKFTKNKVRISNLSYSEMKD